MWIVFRFCLDILAHPSHVPVDKNWTPKLNGSFFQGSYVKCSSVYDQGPENLCLLSTALLRMDFGGWGVMMTIPLHLGWGKFEACIFATFPRISLWDQISFILAGIGFNYTNFGANLYILGCLKLYFLYYLCVP